MVDDRIRETTNADLAGDPYDPEFTRAIENQPAARQVFQYYVLDRISHGDDVATTQALTFLLNSRKIDVVEEGAFIQSVVSVSIRSQVRPFHFEREKIYSPNIYSYFRSSLLPAWLSARPC